MRPPIPCRSRISAHLVRIWSVTWTIRAIVSAGIRTTCSGGHAAFARNRAPAHADPNRQDSECGNSTTLPERGCRGITLLLSVAVRLRIPAGLAKQSKFRGRVSLLLFCFAPAGNVGHFQTVTNFRLDQGASIRNYSIGTSVVVRARAIGSERTGRGRPHLQICSVLVAPVLAPIPRLSQLRRIELQRELPQKSTGSLLNLGERGSVAVVQVDGIYLLNGFRVREGYREFLATAASSRHRVAAF